MLLKADIEKIIPHRSPMLLIDKISEVTPGEYARGEMTLSGNEWFFQGHFPENAVMPGVMIVEAMAQTGAVSILMLDEFKGKTGYFAGIDKARFKEKIHPGDVLELEVKITKRKGAIGIGEGAAYVRGKKAAYATLTFAIG